VILEFEVMVASAEEIKNQAYRHAREFFGTKRPDGFRFWYLSERATLVDPGMFRADVSVTLAYSAPDSRWRQL